MCALFGWLDCGKKLPQKLLKKLTQALANAAEERGTDAAGISYVKNGHVTIYKRPKPAHKVKFNIPENTVAVMGHTRFATQGNKENNCNNHPFYGKSDKSFAFAHNGVLYNDTALRKSHTTINEVKKIISIIKSNEYLKDSKNDCIVTFVLTIKPNKKLAHLFSAIKNNLAKVEIIYNENSIIDIKYLIKIFSKTRIPCTILIKANRINEIMLIYDRISQFKTPICVDESNSIEDLNLNEFLKWAYDINGTKLNIFSDIAEYIILDYWGTCCKYKSCLTKFFMIDTDGNIYSCRMKKNLIGNIYEISQFEDLLNSKAFLDVLKNSVSLRKLCKNKCEYYDICQGGCPLSPYESFYKCRERIYFSMFKNIEQKLKQIIREEDYRNLNPALRDTILFGVASNKLLEGDFFIIES